MKKFREGNNHQGWGDRQIKFPKRQNSKMFLKLEIIHIQNYILWGITKFILNTFFDSLWCHHEPSCSISSSQWSSCLFSLKDYIFVKILFIYFQRGGREGEREGEKHQYVVASHTTPPPSLGPGTWPTTQSCALVGNQTSDPLVCRPGPNPLSPPARAIF